MNGRDGFGPGMLSNFFASALLDETFVDALNKRCPPISTLLFSDLLKLMSLIKQVFITDLKINLYNEVEIVNKKKNFESSNKTITVFILPNT